MTARLTTIDRTPLVEGWGDIDHSTCGMLNTALDEAWDAGATVILLDLEQVSYIDSGGLSVIFSHARRLPAGGWLGLIGANSNVHRLLEIVGILADSRFKLFPDRETAIEAARANGPAS